MLRKIIRYFLIPIFIVGALLTWLLDTTSGVKTVLWLAEKSTDIQITRAETEGSLSHTVLLQQVQIRHPKFSLTAETLKIEPKILALFNNTLQVANLEIEQGVLTLADLPKLPVEIETLKTNFEFKTPRLLESINLQELKGHFSGKRLEGKGQLLIENKQLKELQTEFNWGLSKLSIMPYVKKTPETIGTLQNNPHENMPIEKNAAEPQFLWQMNFHPDEQWQIDSKGIFSAKDNLSAVEGTLLEATLSSGVVEPWQLTAPSDFKINAEEIHLSPLRFQSAQNAAMLIEAEWQKQKGGNLNVQIPEFKFRLPETNARIALNLNLSQTPGQPPSGYAKLKLSPGKAKFTLPGNKLYFSVYQGGELNAIWQKEGLNLDLQLKESPGNTLSATAFVPQFSFDKDFSEQTIKGDFKGRFVDLSIAYLLAPPISRLKAILDVTGEISGTLAKPQVNLAARLHDAIFSVPKQRITVKDFSADLLGEIPGQLKLNSSGTLGGNRFYITGNFEPFSEQGKNTLDITGERLRVFNTANIMVIASPKLHAIIDDHKLFVSGELRIPEADIQQKDDVSYVVRSNDVIFVDNRDDEDLIESLSLVPDIELFIEDEDKVHFKGYGLDAILRGKIKIEQRPDGPFVGTGRLTIKEGKYRLQGSQYHIHRGHLLYPPGTLLNDPILDIRIAKQRAQNEETSEVGIYVQGNLKNPTYSLFSSDHLENTEILSRLGFGGSQSEGEDGRKLLSQSVMFLAGGANPLIETLQTKLGLEEFGLQTAESQRVFSTQSSHDTVLVVGKSLNKHFYLQFIQGMIEPVSLLRLKYMLSPRYAVSVETSTAEDVGADISFSTETN